MRQQPDAAVEPATPQVTAPADAAAVPMPVRCAGDVGRALARSAPGTRAALARRLQSGAGNRAVVRALQRYKDTDRAGSWKAVTGGNAIGRIADNGETLTFSSHEAFATDALINQADGMLAIRESGVHLYPTADKKTVEAPDGTGTKSLSGIGVTIKTSPSSKSLSGDCREAALDVMGSGPGGGREKLQITEGGARVEVAGEKGDASDAAVRALLIDKKIHETPNYGTMDQSARGKLIEDAQSGVDGMRAAERETIRSTSLDAARAKEIGVDEYANPGVGEAYTAVTAPAPMPNQYRFHFAAVIMAPGNDRVTMENEGESPGVRNENWKIETYSLVEPRKTFHQEHAALTKPATRSSCATARRRRLTRPRSSGCRRRTSSSATARRPATTNGATSSASCSSAR